MRTSEKIDQIAPALLAAQKEINRAHKNSENPYFKSTYADLGEVILAVKTPLNNAGITFMQLVSVDEGGDFVETVLLHESGQYIISRAPVVVAKKNDPQAFGSGLTYIKRYALQAITGLPTDDDDAEGAMGPRTPPPPKPENPEAKAKRVFAEAIQAKAHADLERVLIKDELRKCAESAKKLLAEDYEEAADKLALVEFEQDSEGNVVGLVNSVNE